MTAAEQLLAFVGMSRTEITDALVGNADRLVGLARRRVADAQRELERAEQRAAAMRAQRAPVTAPNDSDEGARSATSVLARSAAIEAVNENAVSSSEQP